MGLEQLRLDPHSFRFQIRACTEKTCALGGATTIVVGRVLWEETPGRELKWPLAARCTSALDWTAVMRPKHRTSVVLGRLPLHDDSPFIQDQVFSGEAPPAIEPLLRASIEHARERKAVQS